MSKTKHLDREVRAIANTVEPSQALNDFADYIARVVTHPQSPKALTDALCMVIVNSSLPEAIRLEIRKEIHGDG